MKTYALATPVDGSANSTDSWRDGKRYLWLLGLVVPLLPLVAIGLHRVSGLDVVLWLGPVVLLVVVPLIDLCTGLDPTNPPEEVMEALEQDRYYRWITYAYLPVQYTGLVASTWFIATQDAGLLGKIGMAVTAGTVSGVAINTAHELGHKRKSSERWLSRVALAPCFYGHFYIEHNRGHHSHVATPRDPASSRLGESFYRFWPRTVGGSLRSAWRFETQRLARRDRHPLSRKNELLSAWAMSVLLWGALVAWLGVAVLPYLVIQAVFGFSLLEIVNYLEHYGMLRQRVANTTRRRYVRVTPAHSWNSNNIATNVLLYHLQRHSDHHANPTRRFQTLRDFPESPVLPTGYAGMMVLALFPPLFRRMMDPKVVAHYDGDVRLANVQPGKLEKLLVKYPTPVAAGVGEHGLDGSALGAAGGSAGSGVDDVAAARCPGCGHIYRVAEGNELEGFAAGTAWSDIPDDWGCPDCGVRDKVDFVPLTREPA